MHPSRICSPLPDFSSQIPTPNVPELNSILAYRVPPPGDQHANTLARMQLLILKAVQFQHNVGISVMGDFKKEWAELCLCGEWVAGVEYSRIKESEIRGCRVAGRATLLCGFSTWRLKPRRMMAQPQAYGRVLYDWGPLRNKGLWPLTSESRVVDKQAKLWSPRQRLLLALSQPCVQGQRVSKCDLRSSQEAFLREELGLTSYRILTCPVCMAPFHLCKWTLCDCRSLCPQYKSSPAHPGSLSTNGKISAKTGKTILSQRVNQQKHVLTSLHCPFS